MELTKDNTKCYKGDVAKRIYEYIVRNEKTIKKGPVFRDIIYPDVPVSGYFQDGKSWLAFDNTNGCCWVEEFDLEEHARLYAMMIVSSADAIREGCTTDDQYIWDE